MIQDTKLSMVQIQIQNISTDKVTRRCGQMNPRDLHVPAMYDIPPPWLNGPSSQSSHLVLMLTAPLDRGVLFVYCLKTPSRTCEKEVHWDRMLAWAAYSGHTTHNYLLTGWKQARKYITLVCHETSYDVSNYLEVKLKYLNMDKNNKEIQLIGETLFLSALDSTKSV